MITEKNSDYSGEILESFRETVLVENIPEGGLHKTYDDMPGFI